MLSGTPYLIHIFKVFDRHRW